MEKKYEITEKQLGFLEEYLDKKFPNTEPDVRLELIDHLISDFEATTKNGNLSQYISNELYFVNNFISNRVKEYQNTYRKSTWQQFFCFFTDIKLLPITLSLFVCFYILSEMLSDKSLWLSLMITMTVIFLVSIIFGSINNKKLKKFDEIKLLGAEIWLPYVMVYLPEGISVFKNFLTTHSLVFSSYWLFATIYGLAAYMVLKEQKKRILKKYKYLLQ